MKINQFYGYCFWEYKSMTFLVMAQNTQVKNTGRLKSSVSVLGVKLGFRGLWCLHVSVFVSQEPPEDEANIIEKILAVRTPKKEVNTHRNTNLVKCLWHLLLGQCFSPWFIVWFSICRRHCQKIRPRKRKSSTSSTGICEFSNIITSSHVFELNALGHTVNEWSLQLP